MTVSPFDRTAQPVPCVPGVSPGGRGSCALSGKSRIVRTPHSLRFGRSRDRPEPAGPLFQPAVPLLYKSRQAGRQSIVQKLAGIGPKFMLNDVYNRRILELAGTIPRIGRLEAPDASATAHSKLCGSTVTVDLKMEGDTVKDFAHEVKACALGQASSSIMARNVIGAKADELKGLREAVRKMLKENGAPPADGKWADIAVLEPVRDYKARHASTLLTFDAVVDAIDQIERKRATDSKAAE